MIPTFTRESSSKVTPKAKFRTISRHFFIFFRFSFSFLVRLSSALSTSCFIGFGGDTAVCFCGKHLRACSADFSLSTTTRLLPETGLNGRLFPKYVPVKISRLPLRERVLGWGDGEWQKGGRNRFAVENELDVWNCFSGVTFLLN